jgi:caffeoyl-CoA O-methyltransferase
MSESPRVMPIIDPAIECYAHDRTRPESTHLHALETETRAGRRDAGMLCGRLEGRLLQFLVRLVGAKRTLEIGMFTGYSALSVAEALPADGQVITCDINPETTAIAQRHFAGSPHGAKIDVRLGPALETIAHLEGSFDLVFIDADKTNYGAYYEAVLPKVRSGGLIAIDNTLWHGAVLDPKDDDSRAIDALNRHIEQDPRVDNVLLTVRDGLHLVRVL